MPKSFTLISICILAALLLVTTGCRLFNGTGGVSGQNPVSSSEQGTASVRAKIVIPDDNLTGNLVPDTGILADTSVVTITFRILLVNPGNKEVPFRSLTKVVTVQGGAAQFVFDGLPLQTMVGELEISGGNIGGKTDFHGAADLVTGDNEVELSPKGSRHHSDVTANVIRQILEEKALIGASPNNLATRVRNAVNSFPTFSTSTIYSDVLNKFIVTELDPSGFVRFGIIENGTKLELVQGTASLTVDALPLDGATGLSGLKFERILRQGFEGFAYVMGHDQNHRFFLGKFNSADGTCPNWITSEKPCGSALVMSDRTVVVGGTLNGLPLLFRWSGTGTTAVTAGNTTVDRWAVQFPLATSTLLLEPGVEFLEFESGGSGMLFCVVRDPATRLLRVYRVNPDSGAFQIVGAQPRLTVWANPGDRQITIGWDTIPDARSYNLYWHTDSSLSTTNFTERVENAVSPRVYTGLRNGQTYHYLVTWLDNMGRESSSSARISATPHAPLDAVSFFPPNDGSGVGTQTAISVTFSDTIASSTVSSATFTVSSGTTNIPGSIAVSEDLRTVVFHAQTGLPYDSRIEVTIGTGVTTLPGKPLSREVKWSFFTQSGIEFAPPAIVEVNPPHGTSDVSRNTVLTARFSNRIDPSTVEGTTFTVASGDTPIVGTINLDGSGLFATFKPDSALPAGANITGNLSTGIKGINGSPLAEARSWTFGTIASEAVVRPFVSSVFPSADSVDIATGVVITANFSTPVASSTMTAARFTVSSGTTRLGGILVINDAGTIVRMERLALPENSVITVSIATEVADLAGNQLAAAKTWSFRTSQSLIPVPPAQISTQPGTGRVVIAWTPVPGVDSYNLYWSSYSGVTHLTGTRLSGVTSIFTHSGLQTGVTYHYVLTSVRNGVESAESAEFSGTPVAGREIRSVSATGYWFTPETWIGGVVPEAGDDVVINGEIYVNEGTDKATATCRNITIASGSVLRGAPYFGALLLVNGDLINQGEVRNGPNYASYDNAQLSIQVKGNFFQGNSYGVLSTKFTGTTTQTVGVGAGKLMGGSFTDTDPSSPLKAVSPIMASNLTLTLGPTADSGGVLDMDGFPFRLEGGTFRIVNGKLRAGSIFGAPDTDFTCPEVDHIDGWTVLEGNIRVNNMAFDGSVRVLPGSALFNQSYTDATLTIMGSLENNATVRRGPGYAAYGEGNLAVRLHGNLIQNDQYTPTSTSFDGTGDQTVSVGSGKYLTGTFTDTTPASPIVCSGDVVFRDFTLDLGSLSNYLDVHGYQFFLAAGGFTIKNGKLVTTNLQGANGTDFECPVVESPLGPLILSREVRIGNSTFTTDVTVSPGAVLYNRSYMDATVEIKGNLVNNGLIRRGPGYAAYGEGNLILNLEKDFHQNGTYVPQFTRFTGDTTQQITLTSNNILQGLFLDVTPQSELVAMSDLTIHNAEFNLGTYAQGQGRLNMQEYHLYHPTGTLTIATGTLKTDHLHGSGSDSAPFLISKIDTVSGRTTLYGRYPTGVVHFSGDLVVAPGAILHNAFDMIGHVTAGGTISVQGIAGSGPGYASYDDGYLTLQGVKQPAW